MTVPTTGCTCKAQLMAVDTKKFKFQNQKRAHYEYLYKASPGKMVALVHFFLIVCLYIFATISANRNVLHIGRLVATWRAHTILLVLAFPPHHVAIQLIPTPIFAADKCSMTSGRIYQRTAKILLLLHTLPNLPTKA